MTSKRHTIRSGFTLVETMLAIAVLLVAVTGPLTLAAHALQSALVAKDETTATFLAQDGIEYFRYLRDSACLANGGSCTGATAFTSFAACTGAAGGCTAVSIGDSSRGGLDSGMIPCVPATGCPLLNYDKSKGWFTDDAVGANGGNVVQSIFIRKFVVVPQANSDEVQVIVKVFWKDGGGKTRLLQENENLYAWQ